jgi:hypothetical protein
MPPVQPKTAKWPEEVPPFASASFPPGRWTFCQDQFLHITLAAALHRLAGTHGWFSDARTSASRWNRLTRSGSCENSSGQDFYRDIALQLHVAGAIDYSHPAAAKEGRDFD